MRQNIEKIILRFEIIIIIILVLFIIGCSSNVEKINIDNNIEDNYLNKEDAKLMKLAETCPIDQACKSPSCSLWSDINKDGVCDRGHDEEVTNH